MEKELAPIREGETFGDEVLRSLNDFFDRVERGETITVRTLKLDLEPGEYSAEDVRVTRTKIGASQAIFAKLLAVKVKTVQAWEQGMQSPPGPVRRLLDEMNQDPKRWIRMLRKAVTPKKVS